MRAQSKRKRPRKMSAFVYEELSVESSNISQKKQKYSKSSGLNSSGNSAATQIGMADISLHFTQYYNVSRAMGYEHTRTLFGTPLYLHRILHGKRTPFLKYSLKVLLQSCHTVNDHTGHPIQAYYYDLDLSLLDNIPLQVNLIPATVGLLGQVGVNCVPITVIGTGVGCQAIQQSAYCPGDYFDGLVIVDCPPININA
ncbi:hypothetical protein EDD17DRAFT_1749688 [Pisolithus thermaeus]|nr:hypothetical protein EDD17DRAFT_1749688 [Pisolithus thermaeus]